MVAIPDDTDLVVSGAAVQFCSDPRVIALGGVDERALLDYYFTRARRRVVLEVGPVQLRGRLHTRWNGNRRSWFMTPDAPAIVPESLDVPIPDEALIAAPVTRALAIAS